MVGERSERLPWLHEVPRQPAAVPPPVRPKRRVAGPLAGVALFLAAVGGGAYWLGTIDGRSARDADLPPAGPVSVNVAPAERPAPEPVAPVAPALSVPVAETPPTPIEPAAIAPEPEEKVAKPAPPPVIVPDDVAPRLSNRVRERLKHVREEAKRAERSAPAVPAAPAATRPKPRRFALVPPGPRGRIVQLGSYTAVPAGQENWRAIAKRWPYLTTKPRILSPIWMRQQNGWRLYYRLQLGTASQAQSVVICQRLQKAGQPCVVVY